jgi:hypothetical protein
VTHHPIVLALIVLILAHPKLRRVAREALWPVLGLLCAVLFFIASRQR